MDDVNEFSITSYAKGLISVGRSWLLPPDACRRLKNLTVAIDGSLTSRDGQASLIPHKASAIQGFTRYAKASLSRLLYVVGGDVRSRNEAAGTESSIGTLHSSNNVFIVPFQQRVFFADGYSALKKWDGVGASIFNVGITAPSAAPSVATGAAGNLNSSVSGYSPYRWYVTFYAADGTESNPSPASAELTFANLQVSLSSIPTSGDSQVVGRHIYRDGGSRTQAYRVGSIADNTTTTFTDNVADIRLSTVQMPTKNDVAPSGLTCLFPYKERLLAVDPTRPYEVRISGSRPEYWPEEPFDLSIDGGFVTPANPNYENPIVCIGSVGTYVLVGRKMSVDILDGRDFNNFRLNEVSNLGIAGPRAWAKVGGATWFLAADGMIYELSDATPRPVALEIEDKLKSISEAYRASAACGYCDQRFYISLPTTSGADTLVLCYDFRAGAWLDLSGQVFAASMFYSSKDPSTGKLQLLFSGQPGYTDPAGSAFNGIVKFPDSTSTEMVIDYESPALELGDPRGIKKLRTLRLLGSMSIPSGEEVTLSITATKINRDDTVHTESWSLGIDSSKSHVIYEGDLPASLAGQRFVIRLTGLVTAATIYDMTMTYSNEGRKRK